MSTDKRRPPDLFISGWWNGYPQSEDVRVRAAQFALLMQMLHVPTLTLDRSWAQAPMEAIP